MPRPRSTPPAPGRTGIFRVTANPTWTETVLAQAAVRFHTLFPAIELRLETATRAEGLRLLARGETDLHCGGIDAGERLPDFLRRERFLDMTAGIVARRDHPLLAREVTADDLVRSAWIDVDAPAAPAPGEDLPSLGALLEQLHETTHTRANTILRSGSAGPVPGGERPLPRLALAHLPRTPPRTVHPAPAGDGRALHLPLRVRRKALRRGPGALPALRGDRAPDRARRPRLTRSAAGHRRGAIPMHSRALRRRRRQRLGLDPCRNYPGSRGRHDRDKQFGKPRKDVRLRPLRRDWKRRLNRYNQP